MAADSAFLAVGTRAMSAGVYAQLEGMGLARRLVGFRGTGRPADAAAAADGEGGRQALL